ncbi:hypothetical protein [Hymenobacter persicinus]|uniref:Uncharacterized protein n=1 Tax=Hymenobacter persicinus TaxID=2025506 RepID=A0A4V1ZA84_9BACT|nr:hypothetical protein [Hymenobacter persicinus]RYU75472.1 hypothetical protein EWM57_19840 [Hymenobacter persicinus]
MSSRRFVQVLLLLTTLAGCRTSQRAYTFQPAPVAPVPASKPISAPRLVARKVPPFHPLVRRLAAPVRRLPLAKPRQAWAAPEVSRHFAVRPGQAPQKVRRPSRDYSPLVLSVLLAVLAVLLLSASAVGLTGSYIPVVGVLVLLVAGAVFFHWQRGA